MKVVTVRQPFASLIAVGAKTLLDRARPTGYRGRLLIRAGLDKPQANARLGNYFLLRHNDHTWRLHEDAGEHNLHGHEPLHRCRSCAPLEFDVVVASCELVDCVPINTSGARSEWPCVTVGPTDTPTWGLSYAPNAIRSVSDQLPFGDFASGRWVWLLDDVRPTTERCPRCWGAAIFYEPDPYSRDADGEHPECPTCGGAGGCLPVWMRGGPGLRTPEWEET